MKYVFKPLAKSVMIPLGLTAAASAADAEIHKKGSWHKNISIINTKHKKTEDILKTVKS